MVYVILKLTGTHVFVPLDSLVLIVLMGTFKNYIFSLIIMVNFYPDLYHAVVHRAKIRLPVLLKEVDICVLARPDTLASTVTLCK
jgi:hypothetical protein